jgi:hypothetical protein
MVFNYLKLADSNFLKLFLTFFLQDFFNINIYLKFKLQQVL